MLCVVPLLREASGRIDDIFEQHVLAHEGRILIDIGHILATVPYEMSPDWQRFSANAARMYRKTVLQRAADGLRSLIS